MRKVIFDTEGTVIDSFGENYTLKEEVGKYFCLLETEKYYSFKNRRFFLFSGFGEIDYRELPEKKPSFNKIEVKNLDYFLQNGKHSAIFYDEMAQIESFTYMLDFNNNLEKPKIYTKEYNLLLNQLLGTNNERYSKI